jgi:hypothetical protein
MPTLFDVVFGYATQKYPRVLQVDPYLFQRKNISISYMGII